MRPEQGTNAGIRQNTIFVIRLIEADSFPLKNLALIHEDVSGELFADEVGLGAYALPVHFAAEPPHFVLLRRRERHQLQSTKPHLWARWW